MLEIGLIIKELEHLSSISGPDIPAPVSESSVPQDEDVEAYGRYVGGRHHEGSCFCSRNHI